MSEALAGPTRASGKFGHQIVGGFIEPTAKAHWDDINGMVMDMQYFYGSVRSEAGDYWWPIRGFYPQQARYLHLCESKIGEDFTYATDEKSSYGGPVEHGEKDGFRGVWKPDGTPLMRVNDDTMEWSDGDELQLHGTRVGPGLQFVAPDEDEPQGYTSRLFQVTGSIKGVPVTGLVFHDSMHVAEGKSFMRGPVITDLEAAWVAFATEFEDGAIHAGHLVLGRGGFSTMIVHRSDGPSLIAHDVEVVVDFDGPPMDDTTFPSRVAYTGGGQTWIWEAAEGGRCPVRKDLSAGHRWRQGYVHLEGDDRPTKTTEALMETYNGRVLEVAEVNLPQS